MSSELRATSHVGINTILGERLEMEGSKQPEVKVVLSSGSLGGGAHSTPLSLSLSRSFFFILVVVAVVTAARQGSNPTPVLHLRYYCKPLLCIDFIR